MATMPIGNRIRARRQQLKMTQQELAELIGTDHKQIWRYETGKNSPTSEVLVAIARTLDVSTDYLLGLSELYQPINDIAELADDEMTLLNIYRSKSPEGQRTLMDIAKVV